MPTTNERLPGYEIPNTTVHELPSADLERRYQVWVDVPESYATENRLYPVLVVTDANYAFPLVRSIRNRLGAQGRNFEDFILVGLSYSQGDTPAASRSRDYTPSNPLLDPNRSQTDYSAAFYGEAARYRDYLEAQVLPLIAGSYRADMQRKVFVGQSYGGLFGAFLLLTWPQLFNTYLLGSPSLWFDQGVLFGYEQRYAKQHRDLPARVMMYTGAYETVRNEPRYNNKNDLIRDMQRFELALKAHGYPSLQIGSVVLADEDHLSMYPTFVSRGLLWALPGSSPYTGG